LSYSLFLVIFVGGPLVALVAAGRMRVTRRAALGLLAMMVLALLYVTAWDNYLVASRIWYYSPAQVLKVIIGFVPLEEYLFFLLQTLLTGLFVLWLWQRFYPRDWEEK